MTGEAGRGSGGYSDRFQCSFTMACTSGRFSMSRMRARQIVARFFPYSPKGDRPRSIISIASIGRLIENWGLSPSDRRGFLGNGLTMELHCFRHCRTNVSIKRIDSCCAESFNQKKEPPICGRGLRTQYSSVGIRSLSLSVRANSGCGHERAPACRSGTVHMPVRARDRTGPIGGQSP